MDFGRQILVRAHESVLFAGRHPERLRARQACSSDIRRDLLVRSFKSHWTTRPDFLDSRRNAKYADKEKILFS